MTKLTHNELKTFFVLLRGTNVLRKRLDDAPAIGCYCFYVCRRIVAFNDEEAASLALHEISIDKRLNSLTLNDGDDPYLCVVDDIREACAADTDTGFIWFEEEVDQR